MNKREKLLSGNINLKPKFKIGDIVIVVIDDFNKYSNSSDCYLINYDDIYEKYDNFYKCRECCNSYIQSVIKQGYLKKDNTWAYIVEFIFKNYGFIEEYTQTFDEKDIIKIK